MANDKFSIKEAIEFGWETLKKNLGFFLVIGIIIVLVSLVPGAAKEVCKKTDSSSIKIITNLVSLLFQIVGVLLELGLIKISLKLFEKKKVSVSDLFSQYHLFFKYLGSLIIYSLIVLAGLVLFIVPGIIWSVKFRFFSYFIVEEECGVIESLKKSAEITQGYKWDLFMFSIILLLMAFLGILAFFVGILLVLPVSAMASVFIYKKLKEKNNFSEVVAR